jgi:hypothetical protein
MSEIAMGVSVFKIGQRVRYNPLGMVGKTAYGMGFGTMSGKAKADAAKVYKIAQAASAAGQGVYAGKNAAQAPVIYTLADEKTGQYVEANFLAEELVSI